MHPNCPYCDATIGDKTEACVVCFKKLDAEIRSQANKKKRMQRTALIVILLGVGGLISSCLIYAACSTPTQQEKWDRERSWQKSFRRQMEEQRSIWK